MDLLALLALSVLAVSYWRRRKDRLPLPPGPPGHWLWGNEIPSKKYDLERLSYALLANSTLRTYLKHAEWTRQYGPIFSLRTMRRTIIVLGSYQVNSVL